MPKWIARRILAAALAAAAGTAAAQPPRPVAPYPTPVADGSPVRAVYAVADLVTPFDAGRKELAPLGLPRPADGPKAAAAAVPPIRVVAFEAPAANPGPGVAHPVAAQNADALCKLIVNTIRPCTWAANGGTGTVEYHPQGGGLVVTQAPAVQAEVAELLTALRRLQEKSAGCQVALDVRVLEVPAATFDRIAPRLAPGAGPDADCCELRKKPAVPSLTATEAHALLAAVRSDPEARETMAPKITMMDGQRGVIQVGRTEVFQTGVELTAGPGGVARKPKYEAIDLGMRFAARPSVSADRRSVRVELRYETARLAPVVPVLAVTAEGAGPADALCQPAVDRHAQNLTLTLPVGRTAVVPGPLVAPHGRADCGPPVVAKIPYVNRLFHCAGSEPARVRQLILVTPRLVEPACETAAECPTCPGEPRKLTATAAKAPCGACKTADPQVAELVAAYRKACAEGRTEAATAIAVKALALDPACFADKK